MKHFTLQFLALATVLLTVSSLHIEEPLEASCTVTSFDQVSKATSSCTNIVINGITVPAGKTLELNLKTGATVTFKGTIKFEYHKWAGPLVQVSGSKVTVNRGTGSVLDGQGKSDLTFNKFFVRSGILAFLLV